MMGDSFIEPWLELSWIRKRTHIGISFAELVRAAGRHGISKPTVWRHLKKLTEIGSVVHDGKFYRRNPLYRVGELKTGGHFWVNGGELGRVEPQEGGLALESIPREPQSAIYWEVAWRVGRTIVDQEAFVRHFSGTIMAVLQGYLELLEAVIGAPNFASAREIASLLMNYNVNSPLMFLARQLWDHKKRLSLKSLDGKRLEFTIHYSKPVISSKK